MWLCSGKYLACVSGFWGLRLQTSTGALPLDPAGDPRLPLLSPLKKFLATPLFLLFLLSNDNPYVNQINKTIREQLRFLYR